MNDLAHAAYRDLLDAVLDAEWAKHTRTPSAAEMLAALAARNELVGRLVRFRWLAIEDARAAGAGWADIDAALDAPAGTARAEYEAALARQRRYGLVGAERGDPGRSE